MTVARFVEKVRHRGYYTPRAGQTEVKQFIEKFEEHAGKAGFAIILLTPDDVGKSKDETDDKLN